MSNILSVLGMGKVQTYVGGWKEKMEYQNVPKEDGFEPFLDSPTGSVRGAQGYDQQRTAQRYARLPRMGALLAIFAALVMVTILLAANLKKQALTIPFHTTSAATIATITVKKQPKLRLLIPASNIDTNVCKVLLSANVLGYPAPTIINYNQTFHTPMISHGGAHLAKIEGVLKHLRSLEAEADDDVVVIIDGLDAWFQLRPETLIERWQEINRRGNDRLYMELGAGRDAEKIVQDVVFSAQKKCWPGTAASPSCHDIPESSLPPHIYGNATDVLQDGPNPYVTMRHRWLNSGGAMGTVKAVRAIFERTKSYQGKKSHDHKGSDQGYFADVLGEQQLYRNMIAARYSGSGEDAPTLADMGLLDGENYEFGMGLDYEGQLVLATVFCEDDTRWIRHSDREHITQKNKALGMAYSRVGELPGDIARSLPPFAALESYPFASSSSSYEEAGYADELVGWADVPLLTNMRTGFTPVVMHHNAHLNNAKNRINTWWSAIWFQPYARALMDAAEESTMIETDTGLTLSFDELCGKNDEVLFKDQETEMGASLVPMEEEDVEQATEEEFELETGEERTTLLDGDSAAYAGAEAAVDPAIGPASG